MEPKVKAYSTTCEGQGDTEIKIVDEPTWKWIQGEGPVPQTTIDAAKENDDEQDDWEFSDSGSSQNDKVLYAEAMTIDGIKAEFYSVAELVNFCREHEVEILDSFEGGIY